MFTILFQPFIPPLLLLPLFGQLFSYHVFRGVFPQRVVIPLLELLHSTAVLSYFTTSSFFFSLLLLYMLAWDRWVKAGGRVFVSYIV